MAPPIANAASTKASHPKMAILRCWALQRPARAARFLLGCMAPPRRCGGGALHSPARAAGRRCGLPASCCPRAGVAMRRLAVQLGAHVREHGEDPAVVLLARREV